MMQLFVKSLDVYFGNVCELDLVYNFDKAYQLLDELMLGGELQETNKKSILKHMAAQDTLEKAEIISNMM